MINSFHKVGSCTCGNLSFEAHNKPRGISACNCIACQKRTGSAFGIGVFFSKCDVTLEGEFQNYTRTSNSGRWVRHHFCPNCGTTVAWSAEKAPDGLILSGGAFEDQSWIKPQAISFLDNAQQWLDFPKGVPSFAKLPKS